MIKQQQQESHPYLENYDVDFKEYMDLVVKNTPKFDIKTMPFVVITIITCIIGHLISKIDLLYIQLFAYCLLIAPLFYILNRSMESIFNWDYIVSQNAKGKIDYHTIKENSYRKAIKYIFEKPLIDVILLTSSLIIWIFAPSIFTNLILGLGIFIILCVGEQTSLKIRFFFFTRNETLDQMVKKGEIHNE